MSLISLSRLLLFGLLSLTPHALIAGDAPRPNIVFFLIDDLGYADCGFNGGTDIKTPNIDRLAKSGTVLESHYVQPVCSPTRAALMTGRYPTRTGVYTVVKPHATWGLPLSERTLANALGDAGYTTAIVGKWHLGEFEKAYLPMARGFQHQHGLFFGMIDYVTHRRGNDVDWYHDDQPLNEEGYSTHLLTKEACRLISVQPKTKPLFLYVPYNGVHSPHQVPENYLTPYGDLKGARQKLAGMLAAVDEGIGQIVAALDQAGLRENTLIVFSTDNGGPPPGNNSPLSGFKGSIAEGGVRGCAFATWPGRIPAERRLKEPMHIIDWYPTLVKLGGGSLEQKLPIDGLDVWPMLTSDASSPHDAILCAQTPTRAALRMGDWKLVLRGGDAQDDDEEAGDGKKPKNKKGNAKQDASAEAALFKVSSDPGETTDLAAQEPQRVVTMKARLAELLKNAVPPGNAEPAR